MPHALFLGSSLAGIDRLDMIPKPPTHDDKIKRSFKMPSLGLVRRLKGQSAIGAREEEAIEMERTSTRLDIPTLDDNSAREGDADSKPDTLPPVTRKETEMEAAMRKYEADLKAFDRIRWTDLHISHATVSFSTSVVRVKLIIRPTPWFPYSDSHSLSTLPSSL
jgi:metal iron transporter